VGHRPTRPKRVRAFKPGSRSAGLTLLLEYSHTVRQRPAGVLHPFAAMMIRLGMCGFTIGTAEYYRQFPVVEVQHTFYDPPPLPTLERWRTEAPEGFEFTMKAWQVITHLGTSSTYRREPRGPWPDDLVLALCRQLDLVHAVDPFVRPSLTP
jgi:hypothetical protein